jgi:hypothetical protein
MTKEKEVLMETLKNENLRAETRKFTGNLLNKPIIKKEQITPDLNLKNKTESNNIVDVNQNNNNDEINKIEKSSIKKVKKKKKKKKEDDNESNKVLKPGQKYKLSSNTNKNENKKEEDKNVNIKNEDIIKNEVKPIIKDKENKENKNKERKDILNSLNNFQYNFDNLMAIGVHGTKLLKNSNK